MRRIRYDKDQYGYDSSILVDVQTPDDFRSMTLKEKNQAVKMFQEFNKRGNRDRTFYVNERNVAIPLSTIDRLKEREDELRKKNKIRMETLDKIPYMKDGQETGMSVLQNIMMGKAKDVDIHNVKEYDLENAGKPEDVEKAIQTRENRLDPEWIAEKQEMMRDNFISALQQRFNSDADEAVEALKNISPDDFEEIYQMFDEIDFIYIPSDKDDIGEDADYIDKLMGIFQAYFDGSVDTSLKFLNK